MPGDHHRLEYLRTLQALRFAPALGELSRLDKTLRLCEVCWQCWRQWC